MAWSPPTSPFCPTGTSPMAAQGHLLFFRHLPSCLPTRPGSPSALAECQPLAPGPHGPGQPPCCRDPGPSSLPLLPGDSCPGSQGPSPTCSTVAWLHPQPAGGGDGESGGWHRVGAPWLLSGGGEGCPLIVGYLSHLLGTGSTPWGFPCSGLARRRFRLPSLPSGVAGVAGGPSALLTLALARVLGPTGIWGLPAF